MSVMWKLPPETTSLVLAKREKKLRQALKDLGGGPNKIAANLVAQKVVGIPNSALQCPIAKYLETLFPKSCVEVDTNEITVTFESGEILGVVPPKAVSTFIGKFDEEKYPDLCARKKINEPKP